MKRNTFWGRHGGTLLTVASIVGVGATAVLSGLAALKLKPAIDELREADNKEDMVEAAKKIVKAAAPAVGAAATTVGCMVGVGTFDKKKQAAISGVAAAAAQKLARYRDEVRRIENGDEVDETLKETVEAPPSTEKLLFYIPEYGDYFERTMEEVLAAEYHFNRNFILRGYANLSEFFEFLGLNWKPEAEDVGWSCEGEVYYGYMWIDFRHEVCKMLDGLECTYILFPFPPTEDYLDMERAYEQAMSKD